MTEAKELIDQADLLLADALDIAEGGGQISKRDARQARVLAEVARALYLSATVRDLPAEREAWLGMVREGTDAIVAQTIAEPTQPEPSPTPFLDNAIWIKRLLDDHDCHLLIVQKARGAAGNPEAMVTCQTCDKRIPLP